MKLALVKKQYLTKTVQNNIFENIFIIFIQSNLFFIKNNNGLKKKIKDLGFNIKALKNRSNLLTTSKNKIFTIGQTCFLSLYKKQHNLFKVFNFLKKENIILFIFKNNNKIYDSSYLKKILPYKNYTTILNTLFFNLEKLNTPHKNLLF